VRPLVRADLPEVLAIESASNPSPWREGHFLPFVQALPAAGVPAAPEGLRAAARQVAWVHAGPALPGGERSAPVVGFACAAAVADEVELQSIAVDPSVRRQGIGAALLETLVEWAREEGYRTLHLEVRAGNVPALALYRHFGFVQTGLRRGYYQDDGEDALLLSREIQRAGNPI
jgi:ribosomal-protein-alanine N-acetyltransferase